MSNGKNITEAKKPMIHFIMQGKGGVGKSFVSWILAQYFLSKGVAVKGFDTDASNQTFAQFKALDVTAMKLSADGMDIEPRRFDEMMEQLLTKEGVFVVDTGSNTFLPLWKYMIENSALPMLRDAGRSVVLHSVLTGGQAMVDTLNGFNAIADHSMGRDVVVWLNEFFGKVESGEGADTKNFPDMKVYKTHESKVLGTVVIPARSADTFGHDIREITRQRLTFAEALESPAFSLMAKQRLRTVQRHLFDQLDRVFQ